jgi:hypothetical protein
MDNNHQWLKDAEGPITPEEARLLMRLMDGALSGNHVGLMGRLSENMLYNKLALIAEARAAAGEE